MVCVCGAHSLFTILVISSIVFCIGFGFYFLKWMGAGDVKFLTVSTLWAIPIKMFGQFILAVTVMGGIIAVIYIFIPVHIDWIRMKLISLLSGPLKKWTIFMRYAKEPFQSTYNEEKLKTPIPYGIAVVFASLYIGYFVLTGQVLYEK